MPIGTLKESSLHAALKRHYAQPGDHFESEVDGYWIDILRPGRGAHRPPLLIEVQTGSFGAMRDKLRALLERHRVRVVHPVAVDTWLVTPQGRRKSPLHGRVEHIFAELVAFPALMLHERLTLEVVLVREEELREPRARTRRWGKAWRTVDRKLIEIVDWQVFETAADLLRLLPAGLGEEFTTADIARGWPGPRWLAQRAAYCLREMGAITQTGNRDRSKLYARVPDRPDRTIRA